MLAFRLKLSGLSNPQRLSHTQLPVHSIRQRVNGTAKSMLGKRLSVNVNSFANRSSKNLMNASHPPVSHLGTGRGAPVSRPVPILLAGS
jgi:hypothetical protein